jgi:hypothetical protein
MNGVMLELIEAYHQGTRWLVRVTVTMMSDATNAADAMQCFCDGDLTHAACCGLCCGLCA